MEHKISLSDTLLERVKKQDTMYPALFRFAHNGIDFYASVDKAGLEKETDEQVGRTSWIIPFVLISGNEIYARLLGEFNNQDNQKKFRIIMSNNFTNERAEGFNPKLNRVKGLMGTFIEQLISSGIVDRVVSDHGYALSDEARSMYRYLDKNSNTVSVGLMGSHANPKKQYYEVTRI